MSQIKFGTDGWRAVIGEDFIPENISRIIQAFCDWRERVDPKNRKVVLGYDRRLQSESSATLVAEVLAGNNFEVVLSSQFCPTPCVSWMVKTTDAFAGIMVTASHNPWQWNGIKFKEEYGGSASGEYCNEIEKQLVQNSTSNKKRKILALKEGRTKGLIKIFDPYQEYVSQLIRLVDREKIKKYSFKVLHDPLYGSGSGFLKQILGDKVDEIHTEADHKFGGLNPEPIEKNLKALMENMKKGSWALGIATDGDADRIGAVDEKGNFINSHQIFALLLKHYVEDKGLRGPIVKSLSTTQMINILCDKYGLECIETPVGFKYICKELVQRNALMGGEESGGLSFEPHVHERDGILNGLMLMEMMCVRGKTLGELIDELKKEVGLFYYSRHDAHVDHPQIEAMKARLKEKKILEIAGKKVVRTNLADGFQYIFEDKSWLLIRTSGTEPLVRIYSEARSMDDVERILEGGEGLVAGS